MRHGGDVVATRGSRREDLEFRETRFCGAEAMVTTIEWMLVLRFTISQHKTFKVRLKITFDQFECFNETGNYSRLMF